MTLAVHLKKSLAEIDAQPLLDSLLLLEGLAREEHNRARWEASLHDKRLRA